MLDFCINTQNEATPYTDKHAVENLSKLENAGYTYGYSQSLSESNM